MNARGWFYGQTEADLDAVDIAAERAAIQREQEAEIEAERVLNVPADPAPAGTPIPPPDACDSPARLRTVEVVTNFVLAGRARFTLVSRKTGARFTYSVKLAADRGDGSDRPWFVAVLNGPNNEADYQFLGTIFPPRAARQGWGNSRRIVPARAETTRKRRLPPWAFVHGRKSRISPQAPSAKAFAWFWAQLTRGELPDSVEVWHEGRCGKCGRPLTVPESVATGIGPVCAGIE